MTPKQHLWARKDSVLLHAAAVVPTGVHPDLEFNASSSKKMVTALKSRRLGSWHPDAALAVTNQDLHQDSRHRRPGNCHPTLLKSPER